jgi:putative DNA primase/helicase
MAAFHQRLLGYSISGLCTEHKFPIFHGETGRNGKDTLLETIGYTLGPLAGAVTKDVVIDPGGRRYAGAATPHLMELQGKRLVWANEPKEGARLDVAQVKWITGGGRLKGRPLHGNEVEWQPTHTVLLVTNPRPHAPADDLALWERILLIPFTQRFVDNPIEANEHKADKGLKDTLKKEAAGILAWLVRGFLEWRRDGLTRPAKVTEATAAYRESEDLLAAFIADTCIVQDSAMVKASELYRAYADWCKSGNASPMWRNTFAEKMKQRFKNERKTAGNFYMGIGILFTVIEAEGDNDDKSS